MSGERDQLWTRLEKAGFLSIDEKRAAAGYGPLGNEGGGGELTAKYSPDQPRVPAGNSDGGQWTSGGGGGGGPSNDDGLLHEVSRRRAYSGASIAQQLRLDQAQIQAQGAVRRLRELDPNWRAPQSLISTIQGETAHWEAVARAAEARLGLILRDAIPGTNPSWCVNRLRKELHVQGYVLRGPARGEGMIYENLSTGNKVRIMRRPQHSYKNEARQKHFNDFYYRYKSFRGGWGDAITIPNKN